MAYSERSSLSTCILTTTLVLVSVCALHPQFVTLLSTHFIGGALGDGGLYVWLASTFHADPWAALTFDTNGFYPYPTTRAWSDLFFIPSSIIHLLMLGGLSLESAYNITALLAITLNGVALAALARSLGASLIASVCAGVAFANSSYLIGNAGHPQLLYIFWIPLCWNFALVTSSRATRWILAGLTITGAFYCSVYYAVFAATGVAFILALRLITRQLAFRQTLRAGALLLIGLLPTIYSVPAYLSVKEAFGHRGLHEAEAFAASGLSYLSFSSFHPLFGTTSAWTHGEATLCVGYALLAALTIGALSQLRRRMTLPVLVFILSSAALCVSSSRVDPSSTSEWTTNISAWIALLAALTVAIRSPSARTILFAVVAVFFVVSFGPGGNHHKHEPAFAPLTLFYSLVPGFDAIRATGRCGSIVVMGLFLAFSLLLTQLERATIRGWILASFLLTALTVYENYIPHPPLDPARKPPLAVEGLRARIAPDEAVLFLPFSNTAERGRIQSWTDFAILNTQYTQWTAPLRIKTINGYSGQRSKIINELPPLLASFPAGEWSSYLARICGASWIVVTPEWGDRLSAAPLPEGVSLVEQFSDSSALLRVSKAVGVTPNSPELLFAPRTPTLSLSLATPDCPVEVFNQVKRNRSVSSEEVREIRTSNNGSSLHIGERLDPSLLPLTLLLKASRCPTEVRCRP